jgi:hypothetical protein
MSLCSACINNLKLQLSMLLAIYAAFNFLSLFIYNSTKSCLFILYKKIVKSVNVVARLIHSSNATTKGIVCLAANKDTF